MRNENIFTAYLKKNGKWVLLSLIPLIIVGIIAPLRSWVMQRIIDSGNNKELLYNLIFAVFFSTAVFLLEWFTRKSEVKVAKGFEKDLRYDLIRHILQMETKEFEKKDGSYYISKFATDINILMEDGIYNLYDMAMQGIFFVVAVIYILYVNPVVLPLVLAVTAIELCVPKILKKKIGEKRKQYTEGMEKYLRTMQNSLYGFKEIK